MFKKILALAILTLTLSAVAPLTQTDGPTPLCGPSTCGDSLN
jgi:hypothetical protein